MNGLPRPSRQSLAGRLALARADLKRTARLAREQGVRAALSMAAPDSQTTEILRSLPAGSLPAQAIEALERAADGLRELEVTLHA
jgi:hypothetical protein